MGWQLGGSALVSAEFRERLALLSKLLQQRRRLPNLAMLLVELPHAIVHLLQANRVRVPHRTAAIRRESVAVEVDDVDIHGAKGVAFFKNARTFVDQRVDATVHDLVCRNFSLRNFRLRGPLAHELLDFGIRHRAALVVILVPTRAGFLAEASHFAELVARECLADAGLLEMAIFLSNAPAYVETGEIPNGERAHRHSEVIQRTIHFLHAGAFLNQKHRFANVAMKHPVTNEAPAIPDQDANLAGLFRKLHAGGDHFL